MNEMRDAFLLAGSGTATAWRRIAQKIAQDLADGAWARGETLPTAQDLAKRYGVHRHTVRQAYLHLQDLGLVNVRQGRGVFVTGAIPYRIGKRVSFRENLREIKMDACARVRSAEIVPASPEAARDLGVRAGASLWRLRLVSLASGRPVSASTHYLDALRFPDFPSKLEAAEGSVTAAFRSAGVETYMRRSTRISARKAANDKNVLEIDSEAIVLVTRSIDEMDGLAIQSIETVFRADLIEFLIESGP